MITTKKAQWLYWIVTLPAILAIGSGGIAMLSGVQANIDGLTQLGYPAYLCKILGPAKVLGMVAILYGRFRVLKEWAYAGITFNLMGASASHFFAGDAMEKIISPLVLLLLLLISYRLWRKLELSTGKN